MSDGEVKIDLRLMLDKLKGDIAKAAKEISKGLAGLGVGGGGPGSGPGAAKPPAEIEAVTNSAKNATGALKLMVEQWRKARASGIEPGQVITGLEAGSEKPEMLDPAKIWSEQVAQIKQWRNQGLRGYNMQEFFSGRNRGGGLATAPPVASGGGGVPPVIGRGSGAAPTSLTSIISNFFNKNLTGPQTVLAKFTGGLAALRVAFGLVSYAVSMVIGALKMLVLNAAEAARKMYAAALQSGGLPVGFIARRNILAEVLGVGEQDVWQYGKAIQAVDLSVRKSTDTLARNNKVLTGVGWQTSALGIAFRALWSEIALGLAPITSILIAGFTGLAWILTDLFRAANLLMLPFRKLLEMMHIMIKVPTPTASAGRYPTSTFERQGLVVGSIGGGSPAMQTAKNTAKTSTLLEKILQVFRKGSEGYTKMFGAATT